MMKDFLRKCICILISLSMVLSILPPLDTFAEENVDREVSIEYFMPVVKMFETKDGFVRSAPVFLSVLKDENGCVKVNATDMVKLLDIKYKRFMLDDLLEKNPINQTFSNDLKKTFRDSIQAGNQYIYSIEKHDNSGNRYFFMNDSSKMYVLSLFTSNFYQVDLPGSFKYIDEDLQWVPLAMLLNLLDSPYSSGDEGLILFPCQDSAMDLMPESLYDYNYDIVADGAISKFGASLSSEYGKFYRRIKNIFQGALSFNVRTVFDAVSGDTSYYQESIAKQICQNTKIELEYTTDYVSTMNTITSGCSTFYKKLQEYNWNGTYDSTLKELLHDYDMVPVFSSTCMEGQISIQDYLLDKTLDFIDSSEEYEKLVTEVGDTIDVLGCVLDSLLTYMSLADSIEQSNQKFVDAFKTYANEYYNNPTFNPGMPKDFFSGINDYVDLTDGQEINIFKNKELRAEMFNNIADNVSSFILSKGADSVIETLATNAATQTALNAGEGIVHMNLLPKGSVFAKTLIQYQAISLAWDIVDGLVNRYTHSFDALDAVANALYTQDLSSDIFQLIKCAPPSSFEKRRDLAWLYLKSNCLIRQDMKAFYEPKKLIRPDDYELISSYLDQECAKVLHWMNVYAYGDEGATKKNVLKYSKNWENGNNIVADTIRHKVKFELIESRNKKVIDPMKTGIKLLATSEDKVKEYLGFITIEDNSMVLYPEDDISIINILPDGYDEKTIEIVNELNGEETSINKYKTLTKASVKDLGQIELDGHPAVYYTVNPVNVSTDKKSSYYQKITGFDEDIISVWEQETPSRAASYSEPVYDAGIHNNNIYLIVCGTLYVYRLSDGELLWTFEGDTPVMDYEFADDDTIFLSYYYGLNFVAIDKDGNVLKRIETFDENAGNNCIPVSMEYTGDTVRMTVSIQAQISRDRNFVIDLRDYSYWEEFYPGLGYTDEEKAYREYLSNGDAFKYIKFLNYDIECTTCDFNEDGIKELILRGINMDNKEVYIFFGCNNGNVFFMDSVENWSNGDPSIFYIPGRNCIVLTSRLSDARHYYIYDVTDSSFSQKESYSHMSFWKDEHTRSNIFEHSAFSSGNNISSSDISESEWNALVDSLVEIEVFNTFPITCRTRFSDAEIEILKTSLDVPKSFQVTYKMFNPWFWEGAHRWIADIELYSNDKFVAGAAIDPDTMELMRQIMPYYENRD